MGLEQYIDFSNTKFAWARPLGSYSRIQILYSRLIRGKRFQLNKLKNDGKRYLNVACGDNVHPDFINLDYQWRPGIELCWDITKCIPFPTRSIKGIFIEHCLEHLTYAQCCGVLKDFRRVLQPGGVVRIVVPDAELYLDLYQNYKKGEFVEFPYVSQQDLQNGITPMMAVNRVFCDHGHLFAYDAKTLEMMLRNAGFADICKEGFRTGRDENLMIDSEERKIESLYIEAAVT
jgi:predicted SAM-dependent methyltransferase